MRSYGSWILIFKTGNDRRAPMKTQFGIGAYTIFAQEGSARSSDLSDPKTPTLYSPAHSIRGYYFVRTLIAEAETLEVTVGIHSKRGKWVRAKSKKLPYSIYCQISDFVLYIRAILDARQESSKIHQRGKKEEKFL